MQFSSLLLSPAQHTAAVSTTFFFFQKHSSVTFGDFITMQIVFLLQKSNVPFVSADNCCGHHYRAGCRVKKQPHTLSCQTW